MGSLFLIPWAETTWSAAGRVGGRAPLPLSQAGREQADAWSDEIAAAQIEAVHSSAERTSAETARIVAARTGAAHRTVAALAEIDLGLWDGLTTDELKRRYPKIFKRWCSDPTSVCPPEGEEVSHAYARLKQPLEKLVRRQGDWRIAVVLGPLAFGLARCWLESVELSQVRSLTHNGPIRYELTDGTGRATCTLLAKPMARAVAVAAEAGPEQTAE
jgi:broad specificity phosphatase PhoE